MDIFAREEGEQGEGDLEDLLAIKRLRLRVKKGGRGSANRKGDWKEGIKKRLILEFCRSSASFIRVLPISLNLA